MRSRLLRRALLALGLLVVVAVAAVVAWMGPRNVVGMLRYDQRREGHLRAGDAAPDVVLYGLDGRSTTRLHAARNGRPLVLVFGSFT
jgi:hypothetical protein